VEIPFNLPYAFYPGADPVDNAFALHTLLETLIELNCGFLRRHPALPLYRSGVTYGRTVSWDTIPALYYRKKGDCKSLSAALIAQYRHTGIPADPVFRFNPNPRKGDNLYHILVQVRKGKVSEYEDPSKALGMLKETWMGY
jgi:Transglutaminase-like superfamily